MRWSMTFIQTLFSRSFFSSTAKRKQRWQTMHIKIISNAWIVDRLIEKLSHLGIVLLPNNSPNNSPILFLSVLYILPATHLKRNLLFRFWYDLWKKMNITYIYWYKYINSHFTNWLKSGKLFTLHCLQLKLLLKTC